MRWTTEPIKDWSVTSLKRARRRPLMIDVGGLAGRAEEQEPCPPQRRRYSPAGRLLIGAPLRAELLLIGAELMLVAAPSRAELYSPDQRAPRDAWRTGRRCRARHHSMCAIRR